MADHIDHIRKVAGADHVGLGSDFDGIPDTPAGLDGVDKYPALLEELMHRGWTDADIAKLAGERVACDDCGRESRRQGARIAAGIEHGFRGAEVALTRAGGHSS